MHLTTKQTVEKLGLSSDSVLRRLVREGLISPSNKPKEGAKKFFMLFDSKVVSEYKKSGIKKPPVSERVEKKRAYDREWRAARKAAEASPASYVPASPTGIITRLDEMNAKLDRLINLWS